MDLKGRSVGIRIAIVLAAIAISYIIFAHVLTPIFIHDPQSPFHDFFPEEVESALISITVVSLLLSVSIGLVVADHLRLFKEMHHGMAAGGKGRSEADLEVLKKMMSEDEKRLVDEVLRAGEITQDSLRLRLDWSKAKLSTIISVLDRQGVLQRERSGKTYRVRLDPSIKTVQNRSAGN